MAQALPPVCPRCGAPTVPGQRFCANCGLTFVSPQNANNPITPQPSTPFPPTVHPTMQEPQGVPSWRNTGPLVSSAPPHPTQKRTFGRIGCALICLLLLILLGVGSYIGAAAMGIHLTGFGSGNRTQPSVTSKTINSTVTYAGVELTVLTVQQSQSFIDDPNTASNGMVRLDIQERNTSALKVSWLYADSARLLLPDKTIVTPTFARANVGLAPGATQQSIVDFAVPINDRITQLTLRLGAANEAQMDIPLNGHGDLSKYSSKSIKPDAKMIYLGLNWTVVKATEQLSIPGKQASKGMAFIIVTLQVDNTLSQQAIPGSPYDYARLKTGNTTTEPSFTDLPVSFDTGETGKTGTITFLLPQYSTTFTLIFLSQSGLGQSSTDFQF